MTRDTTKLLFDALEFNYPKIALSDRRTDSIPSFLGTPTNITIPHNLGDGATARVWFDPDLGIKVIAGNSLYQDVDGTGADWTNGVTTGYMYLTSTDLVIGYVNLSGASIDVTTIYRIYYPE